MNLANKENQTPLYRTVWQSDINANIFNEPISHNEIKYSVIENHCETILKSLCIIVLIVC